jgi:hypothetical protein
MKNEAENEIKREPPSTNLQAPKKFQTPRFKEAIFGHEKARKGAKKDGGIETAKNAKYAKKWGPKVTYKNPRGLE